MYSYVSVWVCACLHCAHGSQKRMWDTLALELQAAVSHPIWAVGTDLKPSVRIVCILHCSAISAAPVLCKFFKGMT